MRAEPPKEMITHASLWKREMGKQVFQLAILGCSHKQIAEFFQVRIETVVKWSTSNMQFIGAWRKGKLEADAMVAKSLFMRANGYHYQETVTVKNKKGDVIREELHDRYVPKDTTACIKWLAMRQRENWTEVSKSEHTVNFHASIDIRYLSEQIHHLSDADLARTLNESMLKIQEANVN